MAYTFTGGTPPPLWWRARPLKRTAAAMGAEKVENLAARARSLGVQLTAARKIPSRCDSRRRSCIRLPADRVPRARSLRRPWNKRSSARGEARAYGRYSSRTRGAERERPEIEEPDAESASQAAKAAWAKLIREVYEVHPLLCPKCGARMRVIALIEDPAAIERILSWLGLWDTLPACGPSLPGERASPPLIYHPGPDIAEAHASGARGPRRS